MEKITICGAIGRDATIHTGKDDRKFATFSVAVNRGSKDNRTTQWYDVIRSVKDTQAASYWLKGAVVVVVGRPSYDIFNGKVEVTVSADEVEIAKFADKPKDEPKAQPTEAPATANGNDAQENDLPW